MAAKYKIALVVFVISLIGIITLANVIRGEIAIGSEVAIPIIGITLWLFNDDKKEIKE